MASRKERMISDISSVSNKISLYAKESLISNHAFDDYGFTFDVRSIDKSEYHKVSICLSEEDYPDGTSIWMDDKQLNEDSISMRATAVEAFKKVIEAFGLPTIDDELEKGNIQNGGDFQIVYERVHSPPPSSPNAINAVPKKSRVFSPQMSPNYEGAESDGDIGDTHEPLEVEQCLKRDVAWCQQVAGDNSCTFYHQSDTLETSEVVLRIPVDGIEENLAKAWGLEIGKNICVLFDEISVVNYRILTRYPDTKVYQEGVDQATVCMKQLERIVKHYLSENWTLQQRSQYGQGCIFYELFTYVRDRLPNLCDFCVICDNKHELTSMFMPSVCSRDLCIFSYETLGVMANFDLHFNAQVEVTDLLLRMFRVATLSSRHNLILEPFPIIPDPISKTEMAISDKTTDYEKLVTIVSKVPCMATLQHHFNNRTTVEELQKVDPLIFPLIRWVLTSNRAYLMKLPEEDRLPFMTTPHQYLMMLDSPAKEATFREAKKKLGQSTFAFHGSPFENWHSILRRGLVIGSGTALQLVGAAHGKGIYLSPNLSVSMGYALRQCSGPVTNYSRIDPRCKIHGAYQDCTENGRFLQSSGTYKCVALCEVVPAAALKRPQDQIWVLEDADLVCTRFLFIFDGAFYKSTDVVTTKPETLEAIQNAVRKFRKHDG